MRRMFEQTVGRTDGALSWFLGFIGLTRVLGGILLLGLLHNPVPAISGPSNGVALAWDPSPDSSVTGYRIYFGPTSGNYTDSVAVGNVTTHSVPGRAGGVTCFIAITAYDANGLESTFSNEIGYTVPVVVPSLQLSVASNNQVTLTVTGQLGDTLDIQATETFTTWTVIGTVTIGAGGSVDFTDTNAASFPKRFYRTHNTQP